MHFLDHVFPLQYPMYKPGLLHGGRGWLLALIFRTKPLYYAVLAISAYHRHAVMLESSKQPYPIEDNIQQEKHLEICIKALSVFKDKCPLDNGQGVVMAVLQLVFFEVFLFPHLLYIQGINKRRQLFTSSSNTWKPHLNATTQIFELGFQKGFAPFNLTEKSLQLIFESRPFDKHEPNVIEEVMIVRFEFSTIFWFDILDSITAGTAPRLLAHHVSFIGVNSLNKMEDYMGCKNWVMLQIGRIAALHEQETEAQVQQRHFDCGGIMEMVVDIGNEIETGLAQAAFAQFNTSGRGASLPSLLSEPIVFVTRMFAYMATIYLHMVIHGFEKLHLLSSTISEAMKMLHTHVAGHLLPAVVAPLYFIACVASREDEPYFRIIFETPPLRDPLLSHRRRVVPILEEIWKGRQTNPSLSWRDCLRLADNILLL